MPSAGFQIFAKLEAVNPGGSIKDRPALLILKEAIRSGAVGPGTVVIESSSGNMGIGLAQACRYYRLRFICVVDSRTSEQNLRVLRAYGAEIDIVTEPDPVSQELLQARLNRVQALLKEIQGAFWPNQYANQDNPRRQELASSFELPAFPGQRSEPHHRSSGLPGGRVRRRRVEVGFLVPGQRSQRPAPGIGDTYLHDSRTGRPEAILEGSLISARRTAASAALGARLLLAGQTPGKVGLIGTGLINLEIARFLDTAIGAKKFLLYDLDVSRARGFAERLGSELGDVETEVARSAEEVLASCRLISLATTATRPHISDLSACPAGTVLLHISLRDIAPEAILLWDNIVDDVDHVCRERTSVHLAEQASGGRGFIRCTLADIIKGDAPARPRQDPHPERQGYREVLYPASVVPVDSVRAWKFLSDVEDVPVVGRERKKDLLLENSHRGAALPHPGVERGPSQSG